MASRRATTTLNKLALTLASLNATKSSRIPLSQSRAIAVVASARTFSSSVVPFSRPSFVPKSRNAASTKYLASAFTRNFHSTTPNFFSAMSSSQANQNEFIEMACEGIISVVDASQNSKQQVVESEHLMKALLEENDVFESGSSYTDSESEPLSLKAWISQDPSVLGDKVFEKLGANLPFLFKVLSVRGRSRE